MPTYFCRKCNKQINQKDSIEFKNNYFCPVCKNRLSYFGREPCRLSPQQVFDFYDKKMPNAGKAGLTGKQGIYYNPEINTMILECQDALKINPKNIKALFTLAKIYQTRKDFPKTVETLLKIVELEPGHKEASQNLADIFLETKQYNLAIDQLEQLKIFDSSNYLVYYNLGIVYYKIKDLSLALNNFLSAYDLCKDENLKEELQINIKTINQEMNNQ